MALAAVFNALWDIISKKNQKPLWQFVVESKPETIMNWLTLNILKML